MQDNARIHTARIVQDWLHEQEFEVLEWPPYSPDLNPIEHVWARLKELVNEHYCNERQYRSPDSRPDGRSHGSRDLKCS